MKISVKFFISYEYGSYVLYIFVKALTYLKANTKTTFAKLKLVVKAYLYKADEIQTKPYLQRMDLLNPQSKEEKLSKKLLSYALNKTI